MNKLNRDFSFQYFNKVLIANRGEIACRVSDFKFFFCPLNIFKAGFFLKFNENCELLVP